MNDILDFQGQYRWLSNFWPAQVILDGVIYPSVENAYQAAKFHPSQRAPFRECKPGEAKRLGKKAVLPPDWDAKKIGIMADLVRQKFSYGSELGNKLVATYPGTITEGNVWGDVFWGQCYGRGENHLGRILMQHRDFLLRANRYPGLSVRHVGPAPDEGRRVRIEDLEMDSFAIGEVVWYNNSPIDYGLMLIVEIDVLDGPYGENITYHGAGANGGKVSALHGYCRTADEVERRRWDMLRETLHKTI